MEWELINKDSVMLEVNTVIVIYVVLFILAMINGRQRRNFK